MADISKIILPNGDNYDLKVYTDHIAPMLSKTYTDVIGTADNWANAVFFYGKILPLSYYAVWKIHYRIYAEAAGRSDSKAFADVVISGTQSATPAYSSFNTIANTSYRPANYNELYRATFSGITNNYGHLLGVRLYSSWNPATAANARTITIDILSTENCTFEFFDNMTKYADVPGTGETNYSAYTELDWTANGLQETGDSNYYDRLSLSSTQFTAGSGGIMMYSLFMEDENGTYQSIVTTSGTGTSKVKNTCGFRPGKLWYMSKSSNTAAGANATSAYKAIPLDSRYSLNSGSTLTNHKALYLVFTETNGLLYLADPWWSQELPTENDSRVYLYAGMIYANGYSLALEANNPMYRYVDGRVVEYIPGQETGVIGEVRGRVVSFSDGAENKPLKALTVGIEPVQAGSGDPSPDNVRPITGWTGANIHVSPTSDPADGRTYSVEFPSEAGTVYGGTLDVTSGVLTVTHVLYEFTADMVTRVLSEASDRIKRIYLNTVVYDGTYVYQAGICDKYTVVTSYTAVAVTPNSIGLNTPGGNQILINDSNIATVEDAKSVMPVHVCYPLKSPVTYQLTPVEITTLLGTNTLWADTGDILELQYVRRSASDIEYIVSQSDAKTVNGHTVLSNVPVDAVFTDTTYSAGTGIAINGTSVSNTGVIGVKGSAESTYRTGNVNIIPENIGAYKVGKEVSHRNTDAISKDPTYAELTTRKNALDYQILRAVAGVGDWFYSAYLNPDFTVTSNYNGRTGEKGNFSISTLFIPSASSTVSIDVDAIAETPFVLTVEKTSSGNITATDVVHLELWDHTLNDSGGRLTDYKVELLTTGSTSSTGEYTWQTVYERHNVSDKVNGLCITLNPTSYSYLYFRGIRFIIEGATGPTNTAAWNYNCITMSLFRLMDQRPAFSAARAMGALDIHGGEVFGNVKVDGTFQGNGSLITALNGSYISQGTVAVARGGTGQTTAVNAANAFANALGTESTTPQDADYYISQHAGGGATTTTYHRRPMSALWEYITGKISSVLGLTSSTYSGSAAKVNNHTVQSDVPENAVFTDTMYTGTSPITVDGTTIIHANSGVTAASKGDTVNQTPTWGETFKVPSGTVDDTGHLTAFDDHTVTIPSAVATTSANGLMSSSDKTSLNTLTTQMSTAQTNITSLQTSVTALGNLILCGTGKQVASSKWSSSGEEVYLYKADVAMTGVDSSYFPLVQFDDADINSFEFSPKTTPKTNAVTIYCKTKPNRTITIPNIICFKGKSV